MDIIAGPIVRHSTRKEINVWLIVDAPFKTISLLAYSDPNGSSRLSTTLSDRRVKLGAACIAVLVSAKLRISKTCERIYYDVVIDGQGFKDTGMNKGICFPGESLPSILVPHKHQHLLQASCRKPHDTEGIDQLGYAATLLQKKLDTSDRPSQLFLTGDQIYADDVSPILLYSFRELRRKLGIQEEKAAKEVTKHFNPEAVKLDNRKKYLSSNSGFTSGERTSHLITFSDYLCMYLFSFTGVLPDRGFADYETLQPHLKYSNRGDLGDEIKIYKYGRPNYDRDKKALESFTSTVRRDVRRVFANIVVYMIFDDHEVTDDWNLTEANQTNLRTSPIGKQVQINALSTYLLCQHWGNQPHRVKSPLLNQIQKMALNPTKANRQPLETLFDKYWGYVLEQKPPVVVLDTRTQRVFAGDELALMSPDRLLKVGEQVKTLKRTFSLVVISPTPVYGFTEAEVIQLRLGKKFKTFVDREPWVASEFALRTLQAVLSRTPGVKDIILFSGDVHYAFSRRQVLENSGITMWQLCSSAACNSPVGGNKGLELLKKVVNSFQKKRTPYLVPQNGKKTIVTSDKNIGELSLDSELHPVKATLYCRRSDGSRYRMIYNLINPKTYADKPPK
ncbi:hypothetical protein [Thiolapillus sp.]